MKILQSQNMYLAFCILTFNIFKLFIKFLGFDGERGNVVPKIMVKLVLTAARLLPDM